MSSATHIRGRDRRTEVSDASGYRADVDGLRALAILLVVVYHVWFDRVSGGVDVFLMISAFFLTEAFARRMRAGAPLRPMSFWARRFRRLLPAAAVTIVGTLVATGFLVPASLWPGIWREAWASLLYVQNWELAFRSIDYFARETVLPSPLQHFWSLSIQGQVFILWPLLFLLAALIVRRTGRSVTAVLLLLFGIVFVLSLAFSIVETALDQPFAYFDTRTRLWEFALGSLVAVLLPFFRAPAAMRAILGWMGLAGIVLCGALLQGRSEFPGFLALWPTLSAAAIVLAGRAPARGSPTRLLGSAPLRVLGRDAYALYLVHWPILVIVLTVQHRTEAGPLTGAAIIIASIVAARLLAVLVERPLRRWRWADRATWRSALIIGVSLALVAGPLAIWQQVQADVAAAAVAEYEAAAAAAAEAQYAQEAAPPAAVASGSLTLTDAPVVPVATALDEEWVVLGPPCDGRFAVGDRARPGSDPLLDTCRQTAFVGEPTRTILVIGSSHSEQLMGALVPLAAERGWQLVSLLLGGCSLAPDEEPSRTDAAECHRWRQAALDYALDLEPDAVMTVVTTTVPGSTAETLQPGIDGVVDRLVDAGIEVIAVRDNPRFTFDPYTCMLEHGRAAAQCTVAAELLLAPKNPGDALARDGVVVVDLTDAICPDRRCVPVVGNIAVYLDTNHLTETFARAISPAMAAQLEAAGFR